MEPEPLTLLTLGPVVCVGNEIFLSLAHTKIKKIIIINRWEGFASVSQFKCSYQNVCQHTIIIYYTSSDSHTRLVAAMIDDISIKDRATLTAKSVQSKHSCHNWLDWRPPEVLQVCHLHSQLLNICESKFLYNVYVHPATKWSIHVSRIFKSLVIVIIAINDLIAYA